MGRLILEFFVKYTREIAAYAPLVLIVALRLMVGAVTLETVVLLVIFAVAYHLLVRAVARRFPVLGLFQTGEQVLRPDRSNLVRDVQYSVAFACDEAGNEVTLKPSGKAGLLLSGIPGCGKTVTLKILLAAWKQAGAKIRIVDFKDAGDFDLFQTPDSPIVGDDIEGCVAVLREAAKEMTRRAKWLKDTPGGSNYWMRAPQHRPPLYVVAVDECQEAFETSGVSKERKELANEAVTLAKSLVKRGRAMGMFTVLSTQKADSTAIPTGLRDQVGLRLSGEQMTPEAARAAHGDLREGETPAHHLPTGLPGRMVYVGDTIRAQEVQAYYVPDEVLQGWITK